MRALLLLTFVVACGGQSGEEPEILTLCDEVSSDDVSQDDASLGFSPLDVLDLVDGRAWDVAWRDDQEEWYAGSDLGSLTAAAVAGDRPSRRVELDDAAGETCPMAGTWLVIPVALDLADTDDTFMGGGPVSLAARALGDTDLSLEYDTVALPVTTLPEDLEAAAENAVAFAGELGDIEVQLGGTFAALDLTIEASTVEGNTVAAVAAATLTPTD